MVLKSVYLLLLLLTPFWCFSQARHVKKNRSPYPEPVLKVIRESDRRIIANIGKQNFESWLDSVSVAEIPFDNGCRGSHRPCDPVPPMLSDKGRIRITYYFTIPGFGPYANSNFAYQNSKAPDMILEDHAVFPDCSRYPFKCTFVNRGELFAAAKELLQVTDTTLFRVSYPFYFGANFAYFFQTGSGSLTLSANTGEVLEYKYLGPISSYDCSFTQQCRFEKTWLTSAEKFLGIKDTFTLVKDPPGKRGTLCVWEFTSGKAYLVLNGKDGLILHYTNYSGPSADYRKAPAVGK